MIPASSPLISPSALAGRMTNTLLTSPEDLSEAIEAFTGPAAEKGRKLKLIADGPQEEEVLNALKKLIEVDKFNEE